MFQTPWDQVSCITPCNQVSTQHICSIIKKTHTFFPSLSLRFNAIFQVFSRWTWVSRYQNVSILDFIGAKDDVVVLFLSPTNSAKALKEISRKHSMHPKISLSNVHQKRVIIPYSNPSPNFNPTWIILLLLRVLSKFIKRIYE